jgi:hypothetical protein
MVPKIIGDLSPNRRPKLSRRGSNMAGGSGKLALQAPFKLDKTQKQMPKASQEFLQAEQLSKICQGPLRASRRLAGKRPEFDMLSYEGTLLQKRDAPAPQQSNTDESDVRSSPPPNRSPPNKKMGSSKAAKPRGIVRVEGKPQSKAGRQKMRWPETIGREREGGCCEDRY